MHTWRDSLFHLWSRLRGKPVVEFAEDDRIAQIEPWIEPFFKGVMLDTEPLFISNESTIWDFDLGIAEDIQHRCSVFAGRPVELHELSLPLWQLIPRISPKADPRRPADSDLKVDP